MDTTQFVCPTCGSITAPDDAFCSRCGVKLNRVFSIGLGKQIWIYFVSFFLPPLGLIWVWKYFRMDSALAKKVAWISLALTIVSIVLTVWATGAFFQTIQNQMNSYSNVGL